MGQSRRSGAAPANVGIFALCRSWRALPQSIGSGGRVGGVVLAGSMRLSLHSGLHSGSSGLHYRPCRCAWTSTSWFAEICKGPAQEGNAALAEELCAPCLDHRCLWQSGTCLVLELEKCPENVYSRKEAVPHLLASPPVPCLRQDVGRVVIRLFELACLLRLAGADAPHNSPGRHHSFP